MRNETGLVVEMWVGLESLTQREVRQTDIVYLRVYVICRKMVQMNSFAGQEQRYRCREQTCPNRGRKGRWDKPGA